MKRAIAYRRKNKIYFHSTSRTTAGVWIVTEPFLAIESSKTNADKGRCVLEVLESSLTGVRHPEIWSKIFDPFLRFVGVKTWSSFMNSAMSCSIEVENAHLRFIPNRNLGPREGYEPISERAIIFFIETPIEEVGRILECAFEACE